MRFIRFGPRGQEKPGMLDKNGIRRDVSSHFADWDSHFFSAGNLEPDGGCPGRLSRSSKNFAANRSSPIWWE